MYPVRDVELDACLWNQDVAIHQGPVAPEMATEMAGLCRQYMMNGNYVANTSVNVKCGEAYYTASDIVVSTF